LQEKTVVSNEAQRMQLLHDAMTSIDAAVRRLNSEAQPYAGNALLNLALGRLIDAHGQERTAGLMARVLDSLTTCDLPDGAERAMDVLRLDS